MGLCLSTPDIVKGKTMGYMSKYIRQCKGKTNGFMSKYIRQCKGKF